MTTAAKALSPSTTFGERPVTGDVWLAFGLALSILFLGLLEFADANYANFMVYRELYLGMAIKFSLILLVLMLIGASYGYLLLVGVFAWRRRVWFRRFVAGTIVGTVTVIALGDYVATPGLAILI